MKRDSVNQDIRLRKHLENTRRNRAVLNQIILDIKAGKQVSQENQLNLALLAAWGLFQAYPALWRSLVELQGEAHAVSFKALYHFSEHWVER
jgi:hypothetical protein